WYDGDPGRKPEVSESPGCAPPNAACPASLALAMPTMKHVSTGEYSRVRPMVGCSRWAEEMKSSPAASSTALPVPAVDVASERLCASWSDLSWTVLPISVELSSNVIRSGAAWA